MILSDSRRLATTDMIERGRGFLAMYPVHFSHFQHLQFDDQQDDDEAVQRTVAGASHWSSLGGKSDEVAPFQPH